jgi:hypothetical protein
VEEALHAGRLAYEVGLGSFLAILVAAGVFLYKLFSDD